VDPYVKGAQVFCDTNGNDAFDAGEMETETNQTGDFSFDKTCNSGIVVRGKEGSQHVAANGDKIGDFRGVMKSPANSTVVSPLSTLRSAGMSEADILRVFGISLKPGESLSSLDVNTNKSALLASAMTQKILDDLVGVGVGNAIDVGKELANSLKGLTGSLLGGNGLDTNKLKGALAVINGVSSDMADLVSSNANLVTNAARNATLVGGVFQSSLMTTALQQADNTSSKIVQAIANGEDISELHDSIDLLSDTVGSAIGKTTPIAISSFATAGSEMKISGKLQGFDPSGRALTFTEYGDNSAAKIAASGAYTYEATSLSDVVSPDSFQFTVTANNQTSEPGTVTVLSYPYFQMKKVSVNGMTQMSLVDFKTSGVNLSQSGLSTVNFYVKKFGSPLGMNEGVGKHVKVAMSIKREGVEEMAVALDDVVFSYGKHPTHPDLDGLLISYPQNAKMHGYYRNTSGESASTIVNNNIGDVMEVALQTDGSTGQTFNKLTTKLDTMLAKLGKTFHSPFVNGTAEGDYTVKLVISGVQVGSETELLAPDSITVNDGTAEGITVTGASLKGEIHFTPSPYFDMSKVSVNTSAPVSLSAFTSDGIQLKQSALSTVNFFVNEAGQPLGADGTEHVQMAMSIKKEGVEEMSVALDDVVLTHGAHPTQPNLTGLLISYPQGARMHGFYHNANGEGVKTIVNNNIGDVMDIAIQTDGSTGQQFNKLTAKLGDMRKKLGGTFSSNFIDGTAHGSYTVKLVISNIKVASENKLLSTGTITVDDGAGGITVTGPSVTGEIKFP
jgi:hypothetical protein